MTGVKRLRTDLCALGIAAFASLALCALFAGDGQLSPSEARAMAADYLTAPPRTAQRMGQRWAVSDGRDTALLDARTGDLIEIAFGRR